MHGRDGAAAGQCAAEAPGEAGAFKTLTDEEWQADLDALRDGLAQKHKDAFARVKKEDFERAAAELREKIPGMKDYEVVTGFMKLAAMIGDGHTMMVTEVGNPAGTDELPARAPVAERRGVHRGGDGDAQGAAGGSAGGRRKERTPAA